MEAPEGGTEPPVEATISCAQSERHRCQGEGSRARVSAVPYYGVQGSVQADFHVQRVGALEVDVEFGVSDDELIGQGEDVFVDDMGFISLWHKNKTTYVFMWTCV